VRGVYRAQLAPQVGALRRLLAAKLSSKRRRVTAGGVPAKRAPAPSPIGRTLVLGAVAAAALGLGVYALAPMRGEDGVDLHRKVKRHAHPALAGSEPAANEAPGEAPVAPATQAPATAAVAVPAPAAQPAPVARPTVAAATAAAKPAAATAAAKPAAATATSSADSKPTADRKLRFGAARVPGGRQFALRMSGKITGLQGSADKGGFSVTIAGVLSLDRAGPISSAVKNVSRAMIINRGDHAEFSIRFVDGKQPMYQVSADGNTLYVVIQDA
jgi:hypothetical protein